MAGVISGGGAASLVTLLEVSQRTIELFSKKLPALKVTITKTSRAFTESVEILLAALAGEREACLVPLKAAKQSLERPYGTNGPLIYAIEYMRKVGSRNDVMILGTVRDSLIHTEYWIGAWYQSLRRVKFALDGAQQEDIGDSIASDLLDDNMEIGQIASRIDIAERSDFGMVQKEIEEFRKEAKELSLALEAHLERRVEVEKILPRSELTKLLVTYIVDYKSWITVARRVRSGATSPINKTFDTYIARATLLPGMERKTSFSDRDLKEVGVAFAKASTEEMYVRAETDIPEFFRYNVMGRIYSAFNRILPGLKN